MAKLRGELPIHRHCLDQSPLSHALRHRGEPSSTMVQFRASVFHVASSAFYPWMANSELAPQPVAFYAAVFFLVNATYICLSWELIDRIPVDQVSLTVRKIMRFRSITTLCLRGGFGRNAEISASWARNLYLLPDRLSETRSAGSWEADISGIKQSVTRT